MVTSLQHSNFIEEACKLISDGQLQQAERLINDKYRFQPVEKSKRNYSPLQMTEVFLRDGFIDRYKGSRLIFPPVLRVLSHYLPETFPYHKNGKMSVGHIAYWELFPTIDHVIPVSLGGLDKIENWVCCSMVTNSIKSNWTLEQVGWSLLAPGKLEDWDGMIYWFLEQVDRDISLLSIPYIKNWAKASKAMIV